MDNIDGQYLQTLADEYIKLAQDYKDARVEFSGLRKFITIETAKRLPEFRQKKPNIGHQMAELMALDTKENQDKYGEMIEAENLYKGLERVMNAYATRISLGQSLARYEINNT